jgi:hypothetical protein
MMSKRKSIATRILEHLKSTREPVTMLDAIKLTGASSAPRRLRELQECGHIKSWWNDVSAKDFKWYCYESKK